MKQEIVTHVSDVSGEVIDLTAPTVRFAVDGIEYQIDLTADEQSDLRAALAPYLAVARRATKESTQSTRSASSKEIRAWALANGYDVPARGRIPLLAQDAYREAQR